MAFGVPTVHGYIQILISLLAVAWLFHGLALLNSLIMKPGRSARGAVGVVVFFVLVFFNAMRMGRFIPSVALFDDDGRLTFFGVSLPWLAVVLFYIGGVLCFIYLAARRKMGEEKIHPLSKPQAIAALATLSLLMLGGIWRVDDNGVVQIVVLYLLVIAGAPLDLDGHTQSRRVLQGPLASEKARASKSALVGRPVAQPDLSRHRMHDHPGHRDRGPIDVRR